MLIMVIPYSKMNQKNMVLKFTNYLLLLERYLPIINILQNSLESEASAIELKIFMLGNCRFDFIERLFYGFWFNIR